MKIIDAHSLQVDLLWTKINIRDNNTNEYTDTEIGYTKSMLSEKFTLLLLKWLGCCLVYTVLVILGIPLCGILWPTKFRAGVLSIGIRNSNDVIDSDRTAVANTMAINSLIQKLAGINTEWRSVKHVNDYLRSEMQQLKVIKLSTVNSS